MALSDFSPAFALGFLLLLCPSRASSQITSKSAGPSATTTTAALADQDFHCHTGYSLEQCQRDIVRLKNVLSHYPVEMLGHWTWVLIRSQDWKPISQKLRLNPDSPAFTALVPRETFLEEALFAHDPERTSVLMKEWQRSMPDLLELAVSHELGHALCESTNEAAARRFGEELQRGSSPSCRSAKEVRNKAVVAGGARRSRTNVLNEP